MWTYNTDYLAHYGVLGQKWGVRRFQNEDGSLTSEGKERYRTDSKLGNFVRAVSNTRVGQMRAVSRNKGFKKDLKEIKSEYKNQKKEIKEQKKRSFLDDDFDALRENKQKMKQLKSDFKKTKQEARVSAAEALYPWQSKELNEKIQTGGLKSNLKAMVLGEYGSLKYEELSTRKNIAKGEAIVGAIFEEWSNNLTGGYNSIRGYVDNKKKYKEKYE